LFEVGLYFAWGCFDDFAMRAAVEKGGVDQNGGGPGVRLSEAAKAEAVRIGRIVFCETNPI
jgi:hypothetical protein